MILRNGTAADLVEGRSMRPPPHEVNKQFEVDVAGS